MRSLPDRLAGIVRTLDWASTCLRQDGIECAEIATASDELAAIRLDIECGRVLVIERSLTAPDRTIATIRHGVRVAALALALLASVPAIAKDDLPTPPVWVQPQPDCFIDGKFSAGDTCVVAPVDDPAKVYGPAHHPSEEDERLDALADLARIAGIQRQTLDVLREIAADLEAMQMRQARSAP